MQVHNLTQGTPEWHEFRLEHLPASEAAAAMGISSKMKRNELLQVRHTLNPKEYSSYIENVIFADGHKLEEKARLILEEDLGIEFYPVTCSNGKYSASCDGLTLDEFIAFEHKQWNEELAKSIQNGILPDEYMPQVQQILAVTGAEYVIFVCSDGTRDKWEQLEIYPIPEYWEKIVAGWNQFEKDLKSYQPKDIKEKPEPKAILQLPALSIQIKGEVTTSNLPQFKEAAESFISGINTDLQTDEDFANAESTVKFCAETEKKLELAKKSAIAQTASIDELMRSIEHIKESMRVKRLKLEKLVKTQKETIKNKIINDAYELAMNHVGDLASEISLVKFSLIAESITEKRGFVQAAKNKRTLTSLHDAVDTHLSKVKIELDALAKATREKVSLFESSNHMSIFPDIQQLISKDKEHLKMLIDSRISDYERKLEQEAQAKIDAEKNKAKLEAIKPEIKGHSISQNFKSTKPKSTFTALEKVNLETIPEPTELEKKILETVNSLDETFYFLDESSASELVSSIVNGQIKHVKFID